MRRLALFTLLAALGSKTLYADGIVASPIIVNDPDWPPFFYGGKNQDKPGFVKELLSSCLQKNSWQYVFKFHPIKRMRLNMEQGNIDINMYSYKQSRESFVHYGKEKVFTSAYVPFVRSDSQVKIEKIKDFDGLKLGHQLGLRYSDEFFAYIEQRRKNGALDPAPSPVSNLRKLVNHRIDVFVGSRAATLSRAKELGLADKVKPLGFTVRESDYFMALSKKSPRVKQSQDFLERMDQCIRKAKKAGEYCAIAEKYSVSCSD